jgi:integrase/recombinase XerD
MAFPHRNLTSIPKSDEILKTITRFKNWLGARKGLAPGTVALHTGSVRRMIESLGVFPAPEAIDNYICELRDSVSYSHLCHALIAIERYQEFRGEPIRFDRPTKPKRLIEDTLSEADVAVMLASIEKPRNRALLTLLAYSGIRNAELCSLRIEDVDLGGGMVRVVKGKGNRAYAAAVAGPCIQILAAYLRTRAEASPRDWLFVTERRGRKLQPQDLRKIVRVAAQRAGMLQRVHPHLFRHSLAMAMLNRGAHVFTIQRQLGHAHVETTLLYLDAEYSRARNEYLLCAPSYV